LAQQLDDVLEPVQGIRRQPRTRDLFADQFERRPPQLLQFLRVEPQFVQPDLEAGKEEQGGDAQCGQQC